MASIRLSPDVEALAQQVSDEMGLGSIRTAIEAIVRTKWRDYLNGGCECSPPPASAPVSLAMPEHIDAAAALDEVL